MNKLAWNLYLTLMSAAILAGLLTVIAGFMWPVLNEQTRAAHALNMIFVTTPAEEIRLWLTVAMFRYWHVGYLVACACPSTKGTRAGTPSTSTIA